jgi:uncharacterized protein with HEPN domain
MSPRDPVYVGHMLDMAKKAVAKVAGRNVSREFCDEHPEIPWQEIVGMRHKVVHDYLGVDEDIVWQVVTEDLPPLIASLENILTPLSGTNH